MPHLDDNRGLCCLMVNTERGLKFVNSINAVKHNANYKDIVRYNPSIQHSAKIPAKRVEFFTSLPQKGMLHTIKQLTREPFILFCRNTIHRTLKRLGLR